MEEASSRWSGVVEKQDLLVCEQTMALVQYGDSYRSRAIVVVVEVAGQWVKEWTIPRGTMWLK